MKIIRVLIVTVAFAGIAGLIGTKQGFLNESLVIILSGFVSASTAAIYEFVDTKGQGLKIWFQSKFLYKNKDIYLSFAYLYRIEVDGKYLLIRGNRLKDRYQPIGGVYKFYPEAKPFLEKLRYKPHTKLVNNDETDDLRIEIKGKYLLEFYTWFLAMKDREYDPSREFYEEMISSGFLPEDKFRHMHYRKIGVHNKGITKSVISDALPEVIYADIFEVTLSDEQKKYVKMAVTNHPNKLCLASADELKSRKYNGSAEMKIANNAVWLIEEE